jgi:metallo-beta-lactamase family protein
MEIRVLGAAHEVTGSCYLIRTAQATVLLECGQFQGSRDNEARNREPLPIRLDEIDAVVLSHAHIDHSGRLPLLFREGYDGPIHTHHATRALCEIMLHDAAYLHEKDAEWENRKRQRHGDPLIAPLYTRADADLVMHSFHGMDFGEMREVAPGIRVRLQRAGHILGAAIVEAWISEQGATRKIVFSGDLGYASAPIMGGPDLVREADAVIMESTYGDRDHRSYEATLEELAGVFETAERNKGNIIIPAFAVGRTQDLLYLMSQHYEEWGIGRWHVYLDSPMAIQATEVYGRFQRLFEPPVFAHESGKPALANVIATRTSEESMALNRIESGAIIIAGSGMCTGGRVLHHLKHNLWKSRCHVVIVGYQAHGTLGRKLVDKAEYVRLWNEDIRVNAAIHTVGGLSAHADRSGLLAWYEGFDTRPPVHLVHGEDEAQMALASALEDKAQQVRIPALGETIDLSHL